MDGRRNKTTMSVTARWLSQLLLTAMVLRALIPVGYMPDLPAAANGIFKVVICTTDGAKTIAVDRNGLLAPTEYPGNDHPSDQGDHRDHPCAFSGIFAVADRASDALAVQPAVYAIAAVSPRDTRTLPPVRAGPAVGSRAPPHVS